MTYETAKELSPAGIKAVEDFATKFVGMQEEIDHLKSKLAMTELERDKMSNAVNAKQMEITDLRAERDREIASARAETERAQARAAESDAQRVYFETMFRSIALIVEDAKPPAELVNVRRPITADNYRQ